ncbi:MAG: hypothetical protein ACRDLQ_00265, partial [Solirubrobacterales bacterium]
LQDFGYTDTHLDRVRAAGARTVKIVVPWRRVAPANRPADFDPANPGDPRYGWQSFDEQIRMAAARGLEPLLTVEQSPLWAERGGDGPPGTRNPDPAEFAAFGSAIAQRYSGTYGGLPRVRFYEAWNEPNASFFLSPPYANGEPYTPHLYRAMVNSFSAAVHAVRADNVVVAGAQFPFVVNRAGAVSIGPYRFMREVLCLSEDLKPVPNCGPPLAADVWSHHPYTSGDPTHRASNRDAISLGDMRKMKRLLNAAIQQKRFSSSRPVAFWVTEFGWDTAPSDPKGVPLRLHARWVSEALYRMWQAGVSLATWYRLRDGPADGPVQSGLWFRCAGGIACDTPKPSSLQAFRFPFVAFRSGRGRVRVWGRTPGAARGRVAIERSRRGKWRRLRTLRADRNGMFGKRIRGPRRGRIRARLVGSRDASVGFSLTRPPDMPVNPFGSTG